MKVLLVLLAVASFGAQDAQTVYKVGDTGVSAPVVVKQVRAEYTQEAKDARITGSVILAAVVQTDGRVEAVDVIKSLDPIFGLDAAAVAAMKQWGFKPGTKDGKPVAVRIEVEMTFTLK